MPSLTTPDAARTTQHSNLGTRLGIVVGHTHWDREWYLPFEGFRARLVDMLDRLLDILERQPDFRTFVLDGQAIMVEDYLEVHPEAEPRLRRLVRADRLKLGPWYTAVDTFLPDPESLVRNLELGRWSSRRWGGREMQVGHLPDTFGFIGQLPQILRHFGLEDAFAWRGLHPANAAAACWWQSPDESRVLVMRPPAGYCEGALGVVDPDRFLAEALPDILARQDAEPYAARLFVIGCDHYPANPRLPQLAQQLAERVGHPVRVGSLEEMAALIRPVGDRLPVIVGEQRDACLAVCPASVTGTRIPLKQTNQRVEALLLGVAEPLQALAELVGAGCDRAHLRWAWRLLAQNHPHDSIPGCSIDRVHREMMTRFDRAEMVATDAAQRGARRLAAALAPSMRGQLGAIGVVGLVGGRDRLRLRLHAGPPEARFPRFRIVEPDGSEVPYAIVGRGREIVNYQKLQDVFSTVAARADVHLLAPLDWVTRTRARAVQLNLPYVDIELELQAPHAGYRILRIEPGPPAGRTAPPPPTSSAELATDGLRITLQTDGLYLADEATRARFGPIFFSHAGDAGDEYTACPVAEPPVVFAPDPRRARVVHEGLGPRLVVPINARVPARLAADRRHRAGRVRLAGVLSIAIIDRRVRLSLSLANRARDYDLRLVARVPGATTARSGAPFGVEDRALEVSHSSPDAPQQTLPDVPIRGWLAAVDEHGASLAISARGLYEAAVRRQDGSIELAITLLRGVGYLSRGDLETRPGQAGPPVATPDAQCLGEQRWELALQPFGPGELDLLPARVEEFLRPPAIFPVQWSAGHAPASLSLFRGDDSLVVSTLKPSLQPRRRTAAVLHVHNPTSIERTVQLRGRRVRLDETPTPGDQRLKPYEIAAWLVT